MNFRLSVAALAIGLVSAVHTRAAPALPSTLSDRDYWTLIEAFSEPAGAFPSDNLVSNESHTAQMIGGIDPSSRGGIYVGVGPEQNFSYIARLQPQVAFIVDIRRENLDLQLLYKALFELAGDRADFVSRLFSRPRPPGLREEADADELFSAYDRVSADAGLFAATRDDVERRLVQLHGFPLAAADLRWIEHALSAFRDDGPDINYWRTSSSSNESTWTAGVRARVFSYTGLMTTKDDEGHPASYLSSVSRFLAVKNLEARNLIVPIVGDFAGSTALRSVARYAREHDAPIAAFYGSNVPDLLTQHQIAMFCANLSAMPISAASLYLGGDGDGTGFTGPHLFDNVTPNCEVRRAFIGADVRSAIAATALRALPVMVLATRFGVPDAPPPIYPFEIHVATAAHFPIAAYGAAGDEWLAPIGWTGQGVVGVDGGINVELHPVGDQTASGARISYTVIPACLGCILSNAARFFPEAFRQWTEEYDRDGKNPISVPAGLKTATAGPHLVAFELPREGGLIVRGEAFYDAAVEPRYEEIHMSLPEADKELADFLLNYFGGRARPR